MVRVSPDRMSAVLSVPIPEEGQTYLVSDLLAMLNAEKVVYGIDMEALGRIVDECIYNQEIEVAKGTYPIDGKDAYYKYFFETTDQKGAPRILPDGRVDYTNQIETVKKDDVLVEYVEPEDGEHGTNVLGAEIAARRGKKLSMLRGKGFYRQENQYVASFDGKIEMVGDVITVSQVMDISGDVNALSGDIEFTGDVFIKGDVCAGMTVKSGGSITVHGYVEAATLEAEKDIVVNSGINGAGKAVLTAKGDVKGNFFEGVIIHAGGDVTTNSALNSEIEAEGTIYVEGKNGVIIGGIANAVSGIEVRNAGNAKQVETVLCTGVFPKTIEEYATYRRLLLDTKKILASYATFLEKVNALPEEKKGEVIKNKQMEVLRAQIRKKAQLKGIQKKLDDIRNIMNNGAHARIRVSNLIHPGVKVMIGGKTKMVDQVYKEVSIRESGDEILIQSL